MELPFTMTFLCGTCGSPSTKKRNEARAAAGSWDGDSGGPMRPLAFFFVFNFVEIRQEEGVLHVDHEEETCNTIIFWISLVDSTAFRFTTNAACLLFIDSIRDLVKFSSLIVSQFLQYTTFTHNPFLSVIEALTHFLEQKLKIVSFKKLQKKLVWTRMNSSLSLTSIWLISFFFHCSHFRASYTTVNF